MIMKSLLNLMLRKVLIIPIYIKKWVQEIESPIKLNNDGRIAKYMVANKNVGIIASVT